MAERRTDGARAAGAVVASKPVSTQKADPTIGIDLEAMCRQRGGRLTKQRRAVLAKLMIAKRPLTAYEVLDLLKPDDASATPASTYRSLEFLVGIGLAHRLETTRSFVACEHPDHPHAVQFLICRTCGTVVETEDLRIARAADDLGERHGFAVDRRTVELTGLCGTCRSDGSTPR